MGYTYKDIHPLTGLPKAFKLNGIPLGNLSIAQMRVALSEVLMDNEQLRKDRNLDMLLTEERLHGLDSKLKDVRFNKFMQELKSQ